MTDVAQLRLEGGKANAMTAQVLDTIERLVDTFERGPSHAAVLTGYDTYFSAGLALPALIDLERPAMKAFIEQFSRVMLRVFRCEKPIVAAINGHAIAGGCVLALMCDYRIMVDGTEPRIGLNETQLGIGLPAVVLEPLRAQVSQRALATIAIAGVLLPPAHAEEIGLVHRLATTAMLHEAATGIAGQLGGGGREAVRQVKRALRAPVIDAIERTQAGETDRWLDTWFSEEAQRRLRAAVAKMTKRGDA